MVTPPQIWDARMRSWAWALGMLASITALLATTASTELWIPFVSSGSGKTAPVHQPHVARERAELDREARVKSEHEHKLRGTFGSGVVVPADDPAPPPPPPPPADAEEETAADYDIEKVEIPPLASEDAAPSSSKVEPLIGDDANATEIDDERRARSETNTSSRSMLYTWGIGGARVGRPSDPSPTPPGRAEGTPGDPFDGTAGESIDPLTIESAVAAAASGHSALVTDAGALYTAGRNDSAGGGGHGSPPVKDAGQLGRGGRGDAFGTCTGAEGFEGCEDRLVRRRAVPHGRARRRRDGADVRAERPGAARSRRDVRRRGRGRVRLRQRRRMRVRRRWEGGGGGGAQIQPYKEGDACVGGAACRDGVARAVDLSEFGAAAKAVAVAAGRYATAAVLASGEVVTWGLNLCGAAPSAGMRTRPIRRRRRRLPPRANRCSATRAPPPSRGSCGASTVGPRKPSSSSSGTRTWRSSRTTESCTRATPAFDGYAGGLGGKYAPNGDKRLGRDAPDEASALAPRRVRVGGAQGVPRGCRRWGLEGDRGFPRPVPRRGGDDERRDVRLRLRRARRW